MHTRGGPPCRAWVFFRSRGNDRQTRFYPWGRFYAGGISVPIAKTGSEPSHRMISQQQSIFHFPNDVTPGFPAYFSNHFSSSRTLIFPCHGFLPKLWPSPGKISSVLGTPSECRAWSRR